MKTCFVIMPFRPELRFMYDVLSAHIQDNFPDVICKRGDDNILTVPILEKIANDIRSADVLIADCTGRNPNVFYELGMAHAFGRQVILITADDVRDAPTDIRSLEFVHYAQDPKIFLEKLDNALKNALGDPFKPLYECVSAMFDEFRAAIGPVAKATRDQFTAGAVIKVRTTGMPRLDDQKMIAKHFLQLMLPQPVDVDLALKMSDWSKAKYP